MVAFSACVRPTLSFIESSAGRFRGMASGDPAGSVDAGHNVPETPTLELDSARTAFERQRMDQPPYHLDHIRCEAEAMGTP